MDAAEWQGRFDRAVAYWNQRRFYEAHEDWEALWLEAEGAQRLWLQGLIQYAAAFVHYERGFHANGFWRLLKQAQEKCDPYRGDTFHMDWATLDETLEPWRAHGRAVEAGADLRGDAPRQAPPRIAYTAGYEAAPLPLDAAEDGAD